VSDRALSNKPAIGPLLLRALAFSTAITVVALAPAFARSGVGGFLAMLRPPHAPDLAPILAASPAVKIHLATIAGAILVAVILMSGVKGSRLHRALGWGWAGFMLTTAISALFIHAPTQLPSIGGVGLLHVFSAVTLVIVPLGVLAARRHDVARHARTMTGLVVGGLGVAGLFAFLPGRLLWTVFFG
jgi:uncharacterized membrane protein